MKIMLTVLASAISCMPVVSGAQAVAANQQGAISMTKTTPNSRRVTVSLNRVALDKAIEEIALQAGMRVGYGNEVTSSKTLVTLDLKGVTPDQAISAVLKGTGLVAVLVPTGDAMVIRPGREQNVSSTRKNGQGVITGRVTDAKRGKGINGARISLGNNTSSVTSEDGSYRLADISAGTHIISVRLVGYAKQTRSVVVGEGAAVTVDFKLEPSANVLDQVIVTGTVVQTELKAVPNAMTVITAKQIEERGITKIDQLFRGDVPGIFAVNTGTGPSNLLDEVTMYSRGITALSGFSAGASAAFSTNPIKTYVDGVELADPKYLSQIDPKSIERIEILTGPQASTIYGSNAINGVMQVFTKRGSSPRPQLTLNLLSGWVENNFSNARTANHDYSAQLTGIEGRLSYSVGGSWNYMGPWSPAKQYSRFGGFGGAKFDMVTSVGRLSTDFSLRRTLGRSLQRGNGQQTWTGYRETGWYFPESASSTSARSPFTQRSVAGQTLGMTLSYNPTDWWSHELGFGTDDSNTETQADKGYRFISDTTLQLTQIRNSRRSLRYTSTTRVALGGFAQATLTAGADAWQNILSNSQSSSRVLTGTLTGATTFSRQPGHNTGAFMQGQIGFWEHLFITSGLRAEWNPNYGDDEEPNLSPRYGVALTQDVGLATVKLRGAYGRSTRPPAPSLKIGRTVSAGATEGDLAFLNFAYVPYYGADFLNATYLFDNPALGPEYQQGGEGGLEVYFGNRGSLVVTRFNQTVDHLIDQPRVDSIRSLIPCTGSCFAISRDEAGYGYYYQYQNLNFASIRNQGWELQGSFNAGPLTTRGTYSWLKSRTIGTIARYSSFFDAVSYPQYKPGASFKYLPEHSWGLGVTYARAASSLGLNIMGTGGLTTLLDDFYVRNLDAGVRLFQNRLNVTAPVGSYFNFNEGYATADLTASHSFGSYMEGLLNVQNLTNNYTNDYYASFATMGRQVKIGARIRTR